MITPLLAAVLAGAALQPVSYSWTIPDPLLGMRMLNPHELLAAQFGRFAAACDLTAAPTKSEKVKLIGNSVPPEVAEAVVAANVGDWRAGTERCLLTQEAA